MEGGGTLVRNIGKVKYVVKDEDGQGYNGKDKFERMRGSDCGLFNLECRRQKRKVGI